MHRGGEQRGRYAEREREGGERNRGGEQRGRDAEREKRNNFRELTLSHNNQLAASIEIIING